MVADVVVVVDIADIVAAGVVVDVAHIVVAGQIGAVVAAKVLLVVVRTGLVCADDSPDTHPASILALVAAAAFELAVAAGVVGILVSAALLEV